MTDSLGAKALLCSAGRFPAADLASRQSWEERAQRALRQWVHSSCYPGSGFTAQRLSAAHLHAASDTSAGQALWGHFLVLLVTNGLDSACTVSGRSPPPGGAQAWCCPFLSPAALGASVGAKMPLGKGP